MAFPAKLRPVSPGRALAWSDSAEARGGGTKSPKLYVYRRHICIYIVF